MKICDLGNKYRLKVATAPSGVPEALFFFLQNNLKIKPGDLLLFKLLWTIKRLFMRH